MRLAWSTSKGSTGTQLIEGMAPERITTMRKTYFFPNTENEENFFGSDNPICVDAEELSRLAREWSLTLDELMEQVHEANDDEIEEYGIYDAE